MPKTLVIVESPAKAKTINRYLGKDYIVKASMGHIRDLPKTKLGVDVEDKFKSQYQLIPGRKNVVGELQEAAGKVDRVLLAADPDREGEAICWHLKQVLEKYNPNIFRILFNEITINAITEALRHSRHIDEDKFNAQQTRRILDRLVGYLISPLLWKKVGRGLSAGRVQSIAVRLICEREKEIKAFVQEEYWSITASLEAAVPPPFDASLVKIENKKIYLEKEEQALSIVEELKNQPFILDDIQVKIKTKTPPPPHITSTLQQEAFRTNRFSVRKTMLLAQKLYEGKEIGERGLEGLITYMRTDSVRISQDALEAARAAILEKYGQEYVPKSPRFYKNKKKAQDAHEAIRPTSFNLPPDAVQSHLNKDELSLYTLIWNRFMASQMSAAKIEETEFDIRAGRCLFKSKGEVIRFDGFMRLFSRKDGEGKILPLGVKGETLKLLKLDPKQHFTQPPPRYTEGTLVKELEARGIGRPSTYAPIISTIQGRVYVIKDQGKFIPTDLGLFVNDYLVENFPDLMEFKFTARLEEALDTIAEGQTNWQEYLKTYYGLLDQDLEKAMQKDSIKPQGIPAEENCPECGKQLVIKEGRYGRFKACTGYPDCSYKQSMIKKESKPLEETCPECGSQMVERQGKFGAFVACSNYPECKYIKKEAKDTGISCPNNGCEGTLIHRKTRRGKLFYGCSRFPKCKYATWDDPQNKPCPKCGRPFLLKKTRAKEPVSIYCGNEECDYKEDAPEE
ncbi:MAG: type I DNA topoisomerase [Acidobacteria bacterium]|nr:type I DNA topoisomerase [Acidobacteriota bacterium]MBU1475234.1 type I DNA topoisomerase [Acidobacteriota bacterium]